MTTDRGRFLGSIRTALGAAEGRADGRSDLAFPSEREAAAAAVAAEADSAARAGELMDSLAASAAAGGWVVHRAADAEDALGAVLDIARGLGARSAVRSGHAVLSEMGVDGPLAAEGIEVTVMASAGAGPDGGGGGMRDAAMAADLGLTGADFAVAETGSVVLRAGPGVSRIVSLAPPVHVAVVERGTVLAGLDELFALLGRGAGGEEWASYVNIISGPSRSADIEYTLVTGVHGPGEVHLVLVG